MTSPEVIFTICRRTTASPYHILKSLLSGSQPSNDNFSIKELASTQVRVCYGCGGIIRIPPAVVNREYRVYRKLDGTVHITDDRQNCHYHLNPRCVKMKHGDFIPSMLNVPHMLSQSWQLFIGNGSLTSSR